MSGSIFKGYLSIFAGDFGRLATFAIFIPLLVRIITATEYGEYALLMAIFIPLRKFLNFGLFDATKTYGSRSDIDRSHVFITSFWLHILLLTSGLIVSIIIILTAPLSKTLQDSLFFVLLAVVGNQFYNFGRGVLHALKKESIVEPLIPARSVILSVVGLGLAATGYGVTGVFAGFAIGFLCAGAVGTALAFRESGIVPIPHRDVLREYGGALLKFGAPSMLLILLTVGLYKTDILLLTYFRTGAETGYYRAALQVAEFMWVISVGVEMVMVQTTADLWQSERHDRITELLSRLLRYVVVGTVLLIVGVFILGDEFVNLYFGTAYEASVLPLRILLPGVLGFAVARVIWPVLQAGGYLQEVVAATATATVGNVLLNVLLIPRYGIVGAAVATSTTYGGMALLHIIAAHRASLRPLVGFPAVRICVAAAVTGLTLFILQPLFGTLLRLAVLPPVGLVVYIGCIYSLGIVSIAETRSFLIDTLADSNR